MSTIRRDLVQAAINRAWSLIDYNIHGDLHKQHEFTEQTILADNSLTTDEKTEAIRVHNMNYDRDRVLYNEGTRRICENCNQECLAMSYCEYCIQNYLKAKFSNWTSGNNDIDNLIQKCQIESLMPDMIIEWIPYNNLQNIKYLTKGGFSKIYTAIWVNGIYQEWDSENQQLQRLGKHDVILKELENIENASQNWFEEAKTHLSISNKLTEIVPCLGLTQNPSNGNYMLVMEKEDANLREFLQQNNNQLTWYEKIEIIYKIINSLYYIHEENLIHRDLHSGNILYSQFNDLWSISDLGFCGPADKPLTSIYGNLPYIAPEIINGKEYTFKSDIYSIGMLMWEISSGQPPFNNYEHDYDLALKIINGMRPKMRSEIPLKYKNLMEQCWNANPSERPDAYTLRENIREIKLYYQNNPNELPQLIANIDKEANYTNISSKLFTSKIHKFENLPEPKNATEEEQEAFHSKLYDFNIPKNIDDFGQASNQNNKRNSNVIEAGNTRLTKLIPYKITIIEIQYKNRKLVILMMMMIYIIIQIFIQKNKKNLKFLMRDFKLFYELKKISFILF
ncbi:kinase-like domain-containing protein [Rhizophagus diaphanus]|nr:kinase-like domain-containing protein [Rhizophagus diaphanus] [Rhizophagus sp. MUCL 43196]